MIIYEEVKVSKEDKKILGHNYRGRHIGPFKRICIDCNSEIEYSSYDQMKAAERDELLCTRCYKNILKGKLENIQKNALIKIVKKSFTIDD